MRLLSLIFTLGVLVLAISAKKSAEKNPRVLIIGSDFVGKDPDSLKAGAGNVCNKTIARTRNRARVNCNINFGKSLTDIYEKNKRLRNRVENEKWDFLVLQGTPEEAETAKKTQEAALKFAELARKGKSADVTIILYEPIPPLGDKQKKVWEAIEKEYLATSKAFKDAKFKVFMASLGQHVMGINKGDKKFYASDNKNPSAVSVKHVVDRLSEYITGLVIPE
jgi:hypothetical protein